MYGECVLVVLMIGVRFGGVLVVVMKDGFLFVDGKLRDFFEWGLFLVFIVFVKLMGNVKLLMISVFDLIIWIWVYRSFMILLVDVEGVVKGGFIGLLGDYDGEIDNDLVVRDGIKNIEGFFLR